MSNILVWVKRLGTVLAAAAAVAPTNAADSLTCSNAIVSVGMVPAEIVAKCGEPKDKAVETRPIFARTPAGGTRQTGTFSVERWTYDRGYGHFPAVLTFEEGKLKSIELVTRP